MIIAFFKPFDVLSQFTPDVPGQHTLAEFGFPPRVYPVGRLDRDSEGLLLLTDEPAVVATLLEPRHGHERTYHVQVENIVTAEALRQLEAGVMVQGQRTRPAKAERLDPAPVWPVRNPPIRVRQSIPDCWISLTLTEGRNRQVRRMTAAVGHPTLRLLRAAIGGLRLHDLSLLPGESRILTSQERQNLLAQNGTPPPPLRRHRGGESEKDCAFSRFSVKPRGRPSGFP